MLVNVKDFFTWVCKDLKSFLGRTVILCSVCHQDVASTIFATNLLLCVFLCDICISHEDFFTNGSNSNDASSPLYVVGLMEAISDNNLQHSVWTKCDALQIWWNACGMV